MAGRVSIEELRRHYSLAVKATSNVAASRDTFEGFVLGFRLYEKMATELGINLTDAESKRFVPMSDPSTIR